MPLHIPAAAQVWDPTIGNSEDVARSLDALRAIAGNILNYIPEAQWEAIWDYTSTYDCSDDISSALSENDVVFVPPGKYQHASNIAPTGNKRGLIGWGSGHTILEMTDNDVAAITVAASGQSWIIKGLTITRSVTAISGGHGISATGNPNFCHFEDLVITNQYNGLHLGPTANSSIINVRLAENYNDGFNLSNSAATSACQWNLIRVSSIKNAGRGFTVQAVDGPSGCILGEWIGTKTYANSGIGAAFLKSAASPIYDLRIIGGFFGSDGNSEIYVDASTGYNNVIKVDTCERAGKDATGRTLGTAASNVGHGIQVVSAAQLLILGGVFSFNSNSGIISSATACEVHGVTATDNGQSGSILFGLMQNAGRMSITGSRSGNIAGTTQSHGIRCVTDGGGIIQGNDLTGNATGAFSLNTAQITTQIGYNAGATAVGGTVTQGTSKSTGVALNARSGTITMHNASLNAATSVGFTLTNTVIGANDVVVASIKSGATADSYTVTVDAVASGSCRISLRNESGGALGEAVVLSFVVIKPLNA